MKLKENHGSITVLAVAAMIFILIILGIIFMGISNKSASQTRNINQIETEYDANMDKTYKDTVEKLNEV